MSLTTVQRNALGTKPLFYYIKNNELHTTHKLADLRFKPSLRINASGIAALCFLGPGRPIGSAFYDNIHELSPGERVEYYSMSDTVNVVRYYQPQAKQHTDTFEQTAMRVRELLIQSVQRTASYNPALLLSGGLDSSIIGAIMKHLGMPITAYSLDYKQNNEHFAATDFQSTEDAPFVAEMCRSLNCNLHKVVIDNEQAFNALREAVVARGLPGMADIDSSLYLLCSEVSRHHTTVLGGECADELFGGYRWYNDVEIVENVKTLPWMKCANERAWLLRSDVVAKLPDPNEYIAAVRRDITSIVPYLDTDDGLTRKRREMFYLNYYGFMQTLNERNYTMASANRMQILSPFADEELAEYAFNIPWEFKQHGGKEKGLLRYAFRDMLPEAVLNRKKSPFPKTHNPVYLELVIGELQRIIDDSDCCVLEMFDKFKLQELIDSRGKAFSEAGVNWFGQLMAVPQMFAYLIQVEYWLREFNVEVAL